MKLCLGSLAGVIDICVTNLEIHPVESATTDLREHLWCHNLSSSTYRSQTRKSQNLKKVPLTISNSQFCPENQIIGKK